MLRCNASYKLGALETNPWVRADAAADKCSQRITSQARGVLDPQLPPRYSWDGIPWDDGC